MSSIFGPCLPVVLKPYSLAFYHPTCELRRFLAKIFYRLSRMNGLRRIYPYEADFFFLASYCNDNSITIYATSTIIVSIADRTKSNSQWYPEKCNQVGF